MENIKIYLEGSVTNLEDLDNLLYTSSLISSFFKNPISSWNFKNIIKLYKSISHYDKEDDSPLYGFIMFMCDFIEDKNLDDEDIYLFENTDLKNKYLISEIDLYKGNITKINNVICSNKLKKINFINDLIKNIDKIYYNKHTLEINKCTMFYRLINEIITNFPNKYYNNFLPLPFVCLDKITNNDALFFKESLMYKRDFLFDFRHEDFFVSVSYSDLKDNHNINLVNIKFNYFYNILLKIILEIIKEKPIENIKNFLRLEVENINNDVFDYKHYEGVNLYLENINKVANQNKNITFCVDFQVPTIELSNLLTNLSKKLEINYKNMNFSCLDIFTEGDLNKQFISFSDLVLTRIIGNINFDVVTENIERDLFIDINSLDKTSFISYNFTDDPLFLISIDGLYDYPPLYEVYLPGISDIKDDNKDDDNDIAQEYRYVDDNNDDDGDDDNEEIIEGTILKKAKIILQDVQKKFKNANINLYETLLVYRPEYLRQLGFSKMNLYYIFALEILKNNNKLKYILSVYNKDLKDALVTAHIISVNFGKTICYFTDVLCKIDTDIKYKENTNFRSSFNTLVLISVLFNSKKEVNYLFNIINEGLINLKFKNETEEKEYLNSLKTLWTALSSLKSLIYIYENNNYLGILNYLAKKSIDVYNLKLDEDSIIEFRDNMLFNRCNFLKSDFSSNLKYISLDLDLAYMRKNIIDNKIELKLMLPGNYVINNFSLDRCKKLTIRDVFDIIYKDKNNSIINSIAGIDIVILFLNSKIGTENVAYLIYNDYAKNKNIKFIYKVVRKIIYRGCNDIFQNILKYIKIIDNNFYLLLVDIRKKVKIKVT